MGAKVGPVLQHHPSGGSRGTSGEGNRGRYAGRIFANQCDPPRAFGSILLGSARVSRPRRLPDRRSPVSRTTSTQGIVRPAVNAAAGSGDQCRAERGLHPLQTCPTFASVTLQAGGKITGLPAMPAAVGVMIMIRSWTAIMDSGSRVVLAHNHGRRRSSRHDGRGSADWGTLHGRDDDLAYPLLMHLNNVRDFERAFHALRANRGNDDAIANLLVIHGDHIRHGDRTRRARHLLSVLLVLLMLLVLPGPGVRSVFLIDGITKHPPANSPKAPPMTAPAPALSLLSPITAPAAAPVRPPNTAPR